MYETLRHQCTPSLPPFPPSFRRALMALFCLECETKERSREDTEERRGVGSSEETSGDLMQQTSLARVKFVGQGLFSLLLPTPLLRVISVPLLRSPTLSSSSVCVRVRYMNMKSEHVGDN